MNQSIQIQIPIQIESVSKLKVWRIIMYFTLCRTYVAVQLKLLFVWNDVNMLCTSWLVESKNLTKNIHFEQIQSKHWLDTTQEWNAKVIHTD